MAYQRTRVELRKTSGSRDGTADDWRWNIENLSAFVDLDGDA